jgi:hypothetical protein
MAREWRAALREHRVLRFDGGAWFKSYLTAAEAAEARARYCADGMTCEVITDYTEEG